MQKKDEQMKEKVNGYPLFNHIEDEEVKANNRGAVIANIYEDFGNGAGKTSKLGLSVIMAYYATIPTKEERTKAAEYSMAQLKNRGIM